MAKKDFIIGIIHTELTHYAVKAASEDDALVEAMAAFGNGDKNAEVVLGNEYDEVDRMFVSKD